MEQVAVGEGGRCVVGAAPGTGTPTRHSQLINFALFQGAWFAAVLGAAHGHPLLGTACIAAVIAFHVITSARPTVELRFVASVCLAGFVVESLVALQGHIAYPTGQPVAWLAPYWMVALWGLLATTPNVTLRWLKHRPALASLLGAVLGPLSFVSGVRLGGAHLVDPVAALVTMALMWAVLMPALMWLSTRLDGATPARALPSPAGRG